MRFCEIVPSLEEKNGGPSKSVHALSSALARLGNEVNLFATDPANETSRDNGTLHVKIVRCAVPKSLCRSPALSKALDAAPADLIHHHSIWLRTLHYAHRQAAAKKVPLVISPRGMMSPWAWRHRRWRKNLARWTIHPGAFEATAGWHATSEDEAAEIRALGFKQPICVAPNGVVPPEVEDQARAAAYWREMCPDITRRKTALFYSRFHRKKRVLELIDLWLEHAPADWVLLMVGLADDYTAAQLETYILRSSGGGRIHVFEGEGRPAPYAAASVFLLPSHSENFGLAIAEAMANGLPVVTTDTTPWTAINANDAGWCVPWEDFQPALHAALGETEDRRRHRGQTARGYILENFSWEQAATKLQHFYRQLLGLNG